ncbi:hypothetical protein PoB_006733200 [Plakobranchus ocellatus]|uniref:Uncharacterized protein n=1 Tax=Plakobranchus ocellatus TaxID=259542 RepID=A0AAV4D9J3_9GAST|nr:hypothetical protein PoB_006733200 [Plakobranchus ocellatus]
MRRRRFCICYEVTILLPTELKKCSCSATIPYPVPHTMKQTLCDELEENLGIIRKSKHFNAFSCRRCKEQTRV